MSKNKIIWLSLAGVSFLALILGIVAISMKVGPDSSDRISLFHSSWKDVKSSGQTDKILSHRTTTIALGFIGIVGGIAGLALSGYGFAKDLDNMIALIIGAVVIVVALVLAIVALVFSMNLRSEDWWTKNMGA